MKKRILIATLMLFLIGIVVMIPFRHKIKRKLYHIYQAWVQKDSSCPECDNLFTDGVARQQSAYSSKDIEPQNSFEDLYQLVKKGKLTKVEQTDNFEINDLTHSVPLLKPVASDFLQTLGNRYRMKCRDAGLDFVPFKISSMTRSIESVRELQKNNGNAIENSGHLRGKTFDISYLTSKNEKEQKKLFIQTLYELKKEGKCYVKFEISQKCLHITVRD